jgi:hypothetical protein
MTRLSALRHSRRGRGGRRAGFILLFGSRSIISDDAQSPPVRTRCPKCAQETDLVSKSYRTWFTVFFIPIFPISGKTPFAQCARCGAQFTVSAQELHARLQQADQEQNQRAISLYNSLRASPANSVTLNELMLMYASLNDTNAALSAAGEFPQALNASEQCMTTLGRVYLARNEFADAITWFDAAIARNATMGEAHYYRALSYLLKTPSDTVQAVMSARAARSAGHPNADALLKEAESKLRTTA